MEGAFAQLYAHAHFDINKYLYNAEMIRETSQNTHLQIWSKSRIISLTFQFRME